MKTLKFKDGNQLPLSNIYCIGQNYADHNKEMGTAKSDDIIVFLKPTPSYTESGSKIILPKFSNNIHHEVELVVAVAKDAYNISEDEAEEYIAGYAVGIDFTLRDVQADAKKRGIPWTTAKGFFGSAPVSEFYSKDDVNGENFKLELFVNDERRQIGNTKEMIHSVNKLIAHISQVFSLSKGDIIFTGTPEGVSKIVSGDKIKAVLNDEIVLEVIAE